MPTILILGATSDIAVAIANRFASGQFAIQLASRNSEQLKSIQSDISIRFQVNTQTYTFDATRYADHQRFFDGLVPKPDIVCSVFGLMEEESAAFENWDITESMIATNYIGAVSILNIIGKYFSAEKKGVIIGISSVAGERGRKSKLIYGSSKAAFSSYLSGLRNQLFQYGVHVITVKPGFVYTRMTENIKLPKLLTATPAMVANAIYRATEKKKNIVYVKWFWRYIMMIIKLIPESLFKKMNL